MAFAVGRQQQYRLVPVRFQAQWWYGGYDLEMAPFNAGIVGLPSQVTTGLDVEHPVYGGGDVVFAARTSAILPYHLYYYSLSLQTVTELTGGAADEENPSLSPDGNYIAFDSSAPAIGNVGSYTVTGSTPVLTATSFTPNRNVFVMSFSGQGTVTLTADGTNSVSPVWTSNTNNNAFGQQLQIFFSSSGRTDPAGNTNNNYQIYYLAVTTEPSGNVLVSTESQGEVATEVGTSDVTHTYNNYEPAVGPLNSYLSVAYVSNRYIINHIDDNPLQLVSSGDGTASDNPLIDQTAVANLSPAIDKEPSNFTTNPASSFELFSSLLFDTTPPTILKYDAGPNNEIVHVEDPVVAPGVSTKFIAPGNQVKFIVRLSDRQTGGNQFYLQIKDPNSKYQDPENLEHKVYSRYGFPFFGRATATLGFELMVPDHPFEEDELTTLFYQNAIEFRSARRLRLAIGTQRYQWRQPEPPDYRRRCRLE